MDNICLKTRDGPTMLTKLPLGGTRQLRIETSKGRNGVTCSASVVHLTDMGFTHNFFGEDDDFRKDVHTEVGRCTGPMVKKVHEVGLAHLDEIKAEVAKFYAARDAKDKS